MATNNDGMGGTKIEHIALEQTTLIGMQSPNEFPSTRQAEDRVSLPNFTISPLKGGEVQNGKFYDCEPIDTSWLSYGGKYTLGIGNKWHVRVGGGGMHFETIGPVINDGEIVINNAKKGYFIQSNLVQIFAAKRAMIAGTRLDFDFDETYFKGNVTFLNNVTMNGGIYVNGEMMCNHLTTQKGQGMTSFNDAVTSYINPAQSFHIFQGMSLAATIETPKSLLGTLFEGLDITDADDNQSWIEAELCLNTDFLEQLLPGLNDAGIGLIKMLLCLPIKLKFPKGICLISDALYSQNPVIFKTITSAPRIIGQSILKPDTYGPGHTHTFPTPACNFISDTTAMYSEGQKIMQSTPLKHKSNVFNGAESIDKAKEEVIAMAEEYGKKYGEKLLEMCNPFSAGAGSA